MKANGLFSGIPPWWKTAPLKRPMKRSMNLVFFLIESALASQLRLAEFCEFGLELLGGRC